MSEDLRDRNDPELKCLSVERSNFNDPATQAEWTQKRLVWVPSDTQVINVHNFIRLSERKRSLRELDDKNRKYIYENVEISHRMFIFIARSSSCELYIFLTCIS